MGLYKTEPRRKFHLVVADLINGFGGYKAVASFCMVSPESVNKWKQDPLGNGQVVPVCHLQTMLAAAGETLGNLAVQNAADELMQDHFLNLFHRHAYPTEKVFAFIEMLQGQQITKAVNL